MKRCDNCKNSLQLEYQLYCRKKNTDVYPHKYCENFEAKATPAEPQHGREPKPKPECDNCVYLEADKEIINEHIEKIMWLEARLEEPENVKPLAQYLGEYINQELVEVGRNASDWWCKLFEQALKAYESTENVMIQIIKKKERKT